MTALLVIAILFVLILVHELGHFTAAKLLGVRVEEFGVGYPPRALRICKIGATEYTLNWIPFGGFVRLFGDGEIGSEVPHGKGSFLAANRGARAVILVAGVCMNLLAGWVLYMGALSLGVPRDVPPETPGARLLVAEVFAGSPAEAVGFVQGDQILAMIDANNVSAILSPEAVSTFIAERGGKEISIRYMRAGVEHAIEVRPAHAVIPGEAGRPALGIGLASVSFDPLPLSEIPGAALGDVSHAFVAVGRNVGLTLSRVFTGDTSSLSNIVGPVGLSSVVGNAMKSGLGNLLALAGFISVNLAVINLIPIPALDGGRLLLLGVEVVRRKDAPALLVHTFNAIGIGCVLLLMIVVTYHDIARLLG